MLISILIIIQMGFIYFEWINNSCFGISLHDALPAIFTRYLIGFIHLKLCLATATHKFELLKIIIFV